MAATIFKRMIEEDRTLRDHVSVDSAGTSAVTGSQATCEARTVMKERGLSLEDHRSKPISSELVQNSDLILAMTNRHRYQLLRHFSRAKGKIHLLSEFVGEAGEVLDPINRGIEVYRSTADQIERYLLRLKDKLGQFG